MEKSFLIVFLLLSFLSCQSRKEDKREIKGPSLTTISLKSLEDKKITEEAVLNSLSFVRLETTDKVLISQIEQIRSHDGCFYILDNQEKLFVFDGKGRFVRYIGKRGPGPEEYTGAHYFYIHPGKNIIGLVDAASNTLVRYTLDGDYVDRCRMNVNIFLYTQIDLLDGDNLLFQASNSPRNVCNYVVVKESDASTRSYELPFWEVGEESDSYNIGNNNIGSSFYAACPLSDTIYQWTGETFVPGFVLDSGLKHLTREVVKENGPYFLITDARKLRRQEYSPGIDKLCSTDDYLYLEYSGLGYFDAILRNLKTGENALFRCPLDANPFFLFYHNLMCTSEEALVRFLSVDDLYYWKDKAMSFKEPKLEELYNLINPDDNPVLLLYDYKKMMEGVKNEN